MIFARPITVLLRNPTAFGGLLIVVAFKAAHQ
jgi:hypothetical protein